MVCVRGAWIYSSLHSFLPARPFCVMHSCDTRELCALPLSLDIPVELFAKMTLNNIERAIHVYMSDLALDRDCLQLQISYQRLKTYNIMSSHLLGVFITSIFFVEFCPTGNKHGNHGGG